MCEWLKTESMLDFFVKFLNACVSGLNKVSAWLLTKKTQKKTNLDGQEKPCIPKALRWKLYPQGRSTCPNCNRQTSFMRHLFHLARDSVNTVVCYYRLVTFPSFLNYYFFVFIFIAVGNGGYSFHSVWFSCNDFFFIHMLLFFPFQFYFLCVLQLRVLVWLLNLLKKILAFQFSFIRIA